MKLSAKFNKILSSRFSATLIDFLKVALICLTDELGDPHFLLLKSDWEAMMEIIFAQSFKKICLADSEPPLKDQLRWL